MLGCELIEVFKAAIIGVDCVPGYVPGTRGAVEGHYDARIVLVGVARNVLAGGASHQPVASFVEGFDADNFWLVEQDAIRNDFRIESCVAKLPGDVFGCFAVFWRRGQVRLGCEYLEVLAGELRVRNGKESLFDFALGREIAVAEDRGGNRGRVLRSQRARHNREQKHKAKRPAQNHMRNPSSTLGS